MRRLHVLRRARGSWLKLVIRLWGGHVGRGFMVDPGVHLRQPPSQRWHIGDNVYLGKDVILDIWPQARLVLGNGCKIMHGVVLGAHSEIQIGERSQIAEYCSVRDANHDVAGNTDMIGADLVSSPVSLGDGGWVGRGSAVLAGSQIGSNSVIGANSVVTGVIPANSVAVGVPAKVIRLRD